MAWTDPGPLSGAPSGATTSSAASGSFRFGADDMRRVPSQSGPVHLFDEATGTFIDTERSQGTKKLQDQASPHRLGAGFTNEWIVSGNDGTVLEFRASGVMSGSDARIERKAPRMSWGALWTGAGGFFTAGRRSLTKRFPHDQE
jgi:hypothetical protein